MNSLDFAALKQPFLPSELEWRVQTCGVGASGPWAKVVPYIDNRAIQNRLDTVCGEANWRNEFKEIGSTAGFLCGLSLSIEAQWVTKWDGANVTDIEAIKGGLSDAMKRAAVQWGIGRYLYETAEQWAVTKGVEKDTPGAHYQKTKEGVVFYWLPPNLRSAKIAPTDRRMELLTQWKAQDADRSYLTHFTSKVAYGEDGSIHLGRTVQSMTQQEAKEALEFLASGVLPGERK